MRMDESCCWKVSFSVPTARPPSATRGGTLRGHASVVSLGIERASGCLRVVRPSCVSVNASCVREPFHSHAHPMGGGLGPFMRALTREVEHGHPCPRSTSRAQVRMKGLTLPAQGPSCRPLPHMIIATATIVRSREATLATCSRAHPHPGPLAHPWAARTWRTTSQRAERYQRARPKRAAARPGLRKVACNSIG